MKANNYLRCALALFLSFCSIGSWAEERELFSQNFDWMENNKSYTGDFALWTLNGCYGLSNTSNSISALKIMNNYGAFAKTPALGVNGKVKLSFKYATAAGNYADLSLSIEKTGTIQSYTSPLHILKTNGFQEATFFINDVSPDSRIAFSAKNSDNSVAIADVVVAAVDDIPTINLYQNTNNETTLSSKNGMFVDVSTDRTLLPGVCHTMCLPFDMNRAKMIAAVGNDQNPLMYTYTDLDESNNMSFIEIGDNGTVPAGTPFLLKVDKGFENLKFYAVRITATTPTDVTFGSVTFKGTFNPTDLATDGTNLFLGTDNYLYIPALEKQTLGGLRAYINKPKGARLGITFNDETAAIHEVTVPAVDSPLYNLQGQRITQPRTKSLYIRNGKKMIHH